ncbi:metal-sulfur cluster assembly factor [Opitutaceae bacterium TAV4]|nr:metal-sulfur cluster assembly factor [Opitutaceae bacterium TAV4]RRK02062.1 metal-sulfur cluster assembly factor [Opitutaceae bacterium TAV3]
MDTKIQETNPPPPSADALRAAFRHVYDPEFGVSVEDLGLIYGVSVGCDGVAVIEVTLTSMYCPAGEVILASVQSAAEAVPGVMRAEVSLVWTPAWTPDRISQEARHHLGWSDPSPSE